MRYIIFFIIISINSLAQTDLTILNQKESISFTGTQISKSVITINNYIEYKINNQNGINKLSYIVLPQQIDETYKPNCTKVRNIDRALDFIKINNIKIIVESNSIIRVINTEKPKKRYSKSVINNNEIDFLNFIEKDIVVNGQKYMNQHINTEQYGNNTKYIYKIDNLKVGDIVTVKYEYQANFSNNINTLLSNRKFFHSKYPKKHYELTWSYNSELIADTFFVNHSNYKITKANGTIKINWIFNNLPPALAEINSKPYLDLPWFGFLPKPDDFLTRDVDTYEAYYLPTYYYLANHRERKFKKAIVDSKIGLRDKDNLAIDKLVKHFNDGKKSANNLRLMQRFMVDSVEYKNADKYYDREKTNTKNSVGVHIRDGIIEDNNIEFIYAYWLNKMGYNYFTAYVSDNRIAEIGKKYIVPVNSENMLFIPYYDDKYPMYIYPKQEIGYYADELPFYLEGNNILLLSSNDYGDIKRNFERKTKISKTPKSKFSDNYRNVKSKVKVNKQAKAIFETKLDLSGQFSTLTRAVYLKTPTDRTINKQYLTPIWEVSSKTELNNINTTKSNYYYPFKYSFDINYTDNDVITKENNRYKINLSALIHHISIANIDDEFLNRVTDFYPDFIGKDTYNYLLEFEDAVEIADDNNISVRNEFGSYNFSVKQINPNTILISSIFIINSEKVDKIKIKDVFDIYSEINKVKNIVIEFNIK